VLKRKLFSCYFHGENF